MPRLTRHSSLTGWLYTSTRYLAAKARRTEQRRRAREQEAYAMNQLLQSPDSDPAWNELGPVLDDAMHELGAVDCEAVLLRYFESRLLAEVGRRLGLTENAARMRVDRALDKLRAALAKRGVTSTARRWPAHWPSGPSSPRRPDWQSRSAMWRSRRVRRPEADSSAFSRWRFQRETSGWSAPVRRSS